MQRQRLGHCCRCDGLMQPAAPSGVNWFKCFLPLRLLFLCFLSAVISQMDIYKVPSHLISRFKIFDVCLSIPAGRYESFEGLRAEECGILNGCENGRCVRVREGYTCDCFDGYEFDLSKMACTGELANTVTWLRCFDHSDHPAGLPSHWNPSGAARARQLATQRL